jgi:hypothetical protein
VKKHKIQIGLLIFMAIVFINSCELEQKLEGNGNVTTRRVAVQDFSELDIDGVFNVYLKQDDRIRLQVKTDENLQEIIEVEQINDVLYIKTDLNADYTATQMDIYISIPDISYISLEGVTALYCENAFALSDLLIDKSNTGNLYLNAKLNTLTLNASGSGEIELIGKAERAVINNSMVGDISAFNFYTTSMKLDHDGTGDVEIYVLESLEVALSGVGDVYYKGDPESITQSSDYRVGRLYKVE